MSDIQPFGTSTDGAQPDLAVIKAFGCTVIDFSVSADWSSQAGSLSFKIIEDEADGDRLVIPVLGSPHLFELKDTSDNVLFQYIGLVDSFSRSSSTSKTYSVQLTSPLTILSATQVILDGFLGFGGSIEGLSDFSGTGIYEFGSRNSNIPTDNTPSASGWWNVSNLINTFGLLENEDPLYRVPFQYNIFGNPVLHGDYGFSGRSEDGIPLIKLMYALHVGINHLPVISDSQRQQTQGGNLLFGRHNYNINRDDEAIPYYYHFDALGFYNQIKDKLGPQYRVGGSSKSLNEIIADICGEANLEYYCYIDLYTDTSIGDPTLQEDDPNWTQPAICNWTGLNTNKFSTTGGKYGGTIRIQTVDKNSFINQYKPFSNIAYSLIGLEVPDLKDVYWTGVDDTGIHPGKRPISNSDYGLATPELSGIYSDPLDSKGLDLANEGFTDVGTQSIANGGKFPVATEYWDSDKLDDLKIASSDISIKLNDLTIMKVITGGKQSRLVTVPKKHLKCYWGDIILPDAIDPTTIDTETDPLGIQQTSLRKVPVVTTQLDPSDMDDFIFIDMKDIVGDINVQGVFHRGVYAASMYEIRIAIGSTNANAFDKWLEFMKAYKYAKLDLLREYYYPNCYEVFDTKLNTSPDPEVEQTSELQNKRKRAAGKYNFAGGSAFGECISQLGYFTHSQQQIGPYDQIPGKNADGSPISEPGEDGSEDLLSCGLAESNMVRDLLPKIHEKIKAIGDTHYGKSWYLPVPYFKTKEDLDGNNLVGNFERSWELVDSAYVEPSSYYPRKIPQSNQFINGGTVSPFVNYDFNFVFDTGNANNGTYDEAYIQQLNSLIDSKTKEVFNFSEYSLDQLCTTQYSGVSIIHAAPQSIGNEYSFLPYAYDYYYDRTLLPFYYYESGIPTYYAANSGQAYKSEQLAPITIGQYENQITWESGTAGFPIFEWDSGEPKLPKQNISPGFEERPTQVETTGIPRGIGVYNYSESFLGDFGPKPGLKNPLLLPIHTATGHLETTISGLYSLDYEDNGRFQFAYVKCSTGKVFLPPVKDTGIIGKEALKGVLSSSHMTTSKGPVSGPGSGLTQQPRINENKISTNLYPTPIAITPKSISYAQISNRHVYGPWITALDAVAFRGKIEYEQDDSLVPENFLIPTNFGQFGDFTLSQTSGLEGLNLAAQGRANAIDDFTLFAVEEGSIKIPGAPAIKRIGDSLYGLPQVTDISVNVSNSNIDTSYSFKTISPRFNKNNRDIEKTLSKISNKIKKIKFR